ncbi:MAG: hypothetical protein H8D23_09535 [Candidatus Brocadiales bacterium]|nr:hypothetical protein [Candidatus Brocadiales bacterium]
MILDLIEETNQQLVRYTQIQSQKFQQEDIKNTYNEICKLEKNLNELLEAYKLRHHFLSDDITQSIQNNLKNIKSLLGGSKNEFSENEKYKQSIILDNIQKNIQNVIGDVQRVWMLFVQNQIRPYKELARIADTLPLMKENIKQINSLIKYFDELAQKSPNTNVWNEFNSKKKQLVNLLDNLRGLDEDKRQFLDKVRAMRAVVSDLTPELLQWCVEQDIAASLVVRFKDRE